MKRVAPRMLARNHIAACLIAVAGMVCLVPTAKALAPPLPDQALQSSPVVTLNRSVFSAASAVQQITGDRLKSFAEASNLWNAIIKDGVVDAPELYFLQLILRGPGEIRLSAKAMPEWHPEDILFRNYWRTGKTASGLPAPLDYLRRKVELAELNLDAGAADGTARQVVAIP